MTQVGKHITEMTLPNFKAVLWDMDGTLVNSDLLHARCIKQIGQEYGQNVTDDICSRALGVSHRHCYDLLTRELGPMPIGFEEWMTKELDLYASLLGEIETRSNVIDVIRSLHQRSVKQAIFSNNPGNTITSTIKCFERFFDNPSDIFSLIISLDDVPAKPAPDGYLLAAQRLGLKPEECIIIEDSPTGVKAGKAAGIFTIYWPENMSKKLDVQPDLTVENLNFLIA
jgi:HAD superfamily hydrolase (TIGR01509 family)